MDSRNISPSLHRRLDLVGLCQLTQMGVLGYTFIAPLVNLVRAGIPAYDWLLYLVIGIAAVVAPGYAFLRLTHSRLALLSGLGSSLVAFSLGVYICVILTGSPLILTTLLGYALALSGLYALWVLLDAWHSVSLWFASPMDLAALMVALGCVVLLVFSWEGFGPQLDLLPPASPPRLSFWGQWNSAGLPETVLADLHRIDATMYLFTGEKLLNEEVRDQFRSSMERYAAYDVEVMLTPTMPSYDGFVSTVQPSAFVSYTERLLEFADAASLTAIVGVIFDAEPPYSIVDPRSTDTPLTWVRNENDRFRRWDTDEYSAAVSTYAAYVNSYHQRRPNQNVMVSTIQAATFDALDRDQDISIAYKFAAYPPDNWDMINVQVYSSDIPAQQAPYFTWQGVRLAQHFAGDRLLSVSVGIVNEGSMRQTSGFQRLVEDITICRELGIDEVIVFSLGRGLEEFGNDFVMQLYASVTTADEMQVGFSRLGAVVPYAAGVWDAVLDLERPQGLIVWGWIGILLLLRAPGLLRSWSIRGAET